MYTGICGIWCLLASLSMVNPHQIDQPHPTKQKSTVNSCPHPMIKSIIKAPILGLGPSFCENRGIPIHKQKRPLKTVPVI